MIHNREEIVGSISFCWEGFLLGVSNVRQNVQIFHWKAHESWYFFHLLSCRRIFHSHQLNCDYLWHSVTFEIFDSIATFFTIVALKLNRQNISLKALPSSIVHRGLPVESRPLCPILSAQIDNCCILQCFWLFRRTDAGWENRLPVFVGITTTMIFFLGNKLKATCNDCGYIRI